MKGFNFGLNSEIPKFIWYIVFLVVAYIIFKLYKTVNGLLGFGTNVTDSVTGTLSAATDKGSIFNDTLVGIGDLLGSGVHIVTGGEYKGFKFIHHFFTNDEFVDLNGVSHSVDMWTSYVPDLGIKITELPF
jgi:hypothetical protein